MSRLEGIVRSGRRAKAGEHLFGVDDQSAAVYAIYSGCVKEVALTRGGKERIIGFRMPGDLCGIAGLSRDRYGTSAIALEDSEVCVIPVALLEELSLEVPGLSQQFHALLSREIIRSQNLTLLLGTTSADERVALFLLELSGHYGRRGYSRKEFHLRMTRADIGNFLGMELETVSRVFGRLRHQGLVAISRREISILDRDALQTLCARRAAQAQVPHRVGVQP